MKTADSASHRRAQGTSILEILVSLLLLSGAITGTLRIYALAADSTKNSFHVTTQALLLGSHHERQLRASGRSSESDQTQGRESP